MCVVVVLISYCYLGTNSFQCSPEAYVLFSFYCSQGKMAQPVKMEKSLNFSPAVELLFWLSERSPPPTQSLGDWISIKCPMFMGMWR